MNGAQLILDLLYLNPAHRDETAMNGAQIGGTHIWPGYARVDCSQAVGLR